MARQIIKALAMLALVSGLTVASAVVANGQSGRIVRANVPFDFIVSEKTLRAGNYEIVVPSASGDPLVLTSRDGGERVMRQSRQAERIRDGKLHAKLVFHRYGSTYFLAQAWKAGERSGCELAESRQERAIANELRQLAAYRGDTKPLYEVVEVYVTER